MWNDLATILTFIGLFGLFDKIVEHSYRQKVAEFVFGFHDISFREFEATVINGLLSFFIRDTRLSYLRVLTISLPLTVLLVFGFGAYVDTFNNDKTYLRAVLDIPQILWAAYLENNPGQERAVMVFVLLGFPFFAYPFDLYSIWVTKVLFWKRQRPGWMFLPMVLLDATFSLLPVLLLASSGVYDGDLDTTGYLRVMILLTALGLIFQLPSTVLLSIIQVLTVITGVVFRIVARLTKLNRYLVLLGRMHEIPFSFLGFLIGLIVVLIV